MKNNKNNRFLGFLNRHRVFTITIVLFFILLPLLLIPTAYIYQIVSTKHVLFDDKEIKAIQVDEQNHFDIEFTLYNIIDSIGETKGKYVFDYTIKPKTSVNTIRDVSFNAQLSVVRDKYTVYNNGDLISTLESGPNSRLEFTWDYDMDKSVLPFLKPKGPKLYLQIYYTIEYALPLGGEDYETLYIEIPYK